MDKAVTGFGIYAALLTGSSDVKGEIKSQVLRLNDLKVRQAEYDPRDFPGTRSGTGTGLRAGTSASGAFHAEAAAEPRKAVTGFGAKTVRARIFFPGCCNIFSVSLD